MKTIPSRAENPNGLHQRYKVQEIAPDGTVADLPEDAILFVLRLDHPVSTSPFGKRPKSRDRQVEWRHACRQALRKLLGVIRYKHQYQELALDLAALLARQDMLYETDEGEEEEDSEEEDAEEE